MPQRVAAIVAEALNVPVTRVTPSASLIDDLGAESIDFLDIVFKLEQAFGFKIGQGELFPDNVQQDPKYVKDGKVTPEGIAALKARLPHADFSRLEADPQISKVGGIFTVESIVRFCEKKLGAAAVR